MNRERDPIKVVALTANRSDPSSRYRIRQFIRPLAEHNISVAEHYLPMTRYRRQPLAAIATGLRIPGVMASRTADITWLRRELIPERSTLERFTGGKRIFDVDDAIWLRSESDFSERIVAECDGVIAGNEFLAEHYRPLGKPIWIVPTSIETDLWSPGGEQTSDKWVFGWIGTKSNLRFLTGIEQPLADFLNDHPDSRLRVISDDRPQFEKIPADRWEFIRWSPENEVRMTQGLRVGLMPLEVSDWSRGKCAFKMIQYMSVGIPVVTTPIGMNAEMLQAADVGLPARSADDWYDALTRLYEDQQLAMSMGANCRKVVEEKYSVHQNVGKLAEIFREIVADPR